MKRVSFSGRVPYDLDNKKTKTIHMKTKTFITSLLLCFSLYGAAQSIEVKGSITIKTIKQDKSGKIDTVVTKGARTLINLYNKVDSRLISIAEDNGDYFFDIDLSKTPYTHVQFLNMEGGEISFPLKDIKQPFFDVIITKVDGAEKETGNSSKFKIDIKKMSRHQVDSIKISEKQEKKKETKKPKDVEKAKTPEVKKEPETIKEPVVVKASEVFKVPEKANAPEVIEQTKAVESPKVSNEQASPASNQLLSEEPTEDQPADVKPEVKKETRKAKKTEETTEEENAKLDKEIQDLNDQIKKEKEQNAVNPEKKDETK